MLKEARLLHGCLRRRSKSNELMLVEYGLVTAKWI